MFFSYSTFCLGGVGYLTPLLVTKCQPCHQNFHRQDNMSCLGIPRQVCPASATLSCLAVTRLYLGYLKSAQCAADDKCTLVIWKALSAQLMENVPCYLQSTQCAADRKCTLVICEARSWWKMYLGYLRSEQYAADEKCTLVILETRCALLAKMYTLVIWEARSTQLMKNVPWLSEKRAVRSWWKIYLGFLRSAQYAADGKCTLVIWEARSAQLMNKPRAKRSDGEKNPRLWISHGYHYSDTLKDT